MIQGADRYSPLPFFIGGTMDILTAADLKHELTPQDYQTLTFTNDGIAARCVERARMVVKGLILSTGNAYDEDDELCRMCVLKRGRVELYLFNGMHETADKEQSDLDIIIRTSYGPIITKNGATDENGPSVAVIKKPNGNVLDRHYGS